jgi:hypothetical protein
MIVMLAVPLVVLFTPGLAAADLSDVGGVDTSADDDGWLDAIAIVRAGQSGSGLRSGDSDSQSVCAYSRVTEIADAETSKIIDGEVFDLWRLDCPVLTGERVFVPLWIQRVAAADLLPDVEDRARSQIPAPAVSFPNLAEQGGMALTRVPQDFRVANLAPVSASASVIAGPLSAWVTVTATPVSVMFDPGEPRGSPLECSVDAAQAEFVAATPGECSYAYRDSSAIDPSGGFSASVSVEWSITYEGSSGSGSLSSYSSSTSTALPVGEIQAVVTCVGEDCR